MTETPEQTRQRAQARAIEEGRPAYCVQQCPEWSPADTWRYARHRMGPPLPPVVRFDVCPLLVFTRTSAGAPT